MACGVGLSKLVVHVDVILALSVDTAKGLDGKPPTEHSRDVHPSMQRCMETQSQHRPNGLGSTGLCFCWNHWEQWLQLFSTS